MMHDELLHTAFDLLKSSEFALADIKTEQCALDFRKGEAESKIRAAWAEIESLMGESGEFQVLIPGAPGDACDYKIAYGTPRETVKVADVDAVPEEWVKVERKAKLREIGEHLKELRETGQPMPNWGSLEHGKAKLGWKAIKKGSK